MQMSLFQRWVAHRGLRQRCYYRLLKLLGLPRCECASGHRRRGDFSRAEHRLAAGLEGIEVMDFLDGLARADGTFGIPFLLERGWVS